MKPARWFSVVILVGVLALGGVFLVLHSQNDRRYKDCLTAHGIADPQYQRFTFDPCHKSWP